MHVLDLLSLKGKIILVTGGAGNYGKSITEGLSEAGGTVIIASRNLEALQKVAEDFNKEGLDVHAMDVDQADSDSVMRLKDQIMDRFGRLDVFVNNAVSRPMKGYNAAIEQFAASMEVNATGMMFILREMTDLIVQSGGGSVINISSMMGMFGPDLSNYEGTTMGDLPPDYFFHNGGLINLNRYMTKMLTGKNVRFNCISPGGLFNNQSPRFLDNYCKKVPLGRMANKDDIKGLMVLLSSDAGAYINGENILMDGGLNA
ncbi:SDR family oxidoreductase [Chitinophaga sp. MM2321]|uniref:SDR family oxidoreductase n=1 Tax=Chitinophaga sp. MM2321 TaxID=3137178 RepID=UPI0032D58F4E